MEVVKIAAIAICACILISVVKSYRPEFAIYISLGCSIIIIFFLIDSIQTCVSYFMDFYEDISYGNLYFPILIKIIFVAYITDFTAEIAKDQGNGQIASKVELAGKIIIFALAIPIFSSVFSILNQLM